MLAGNGTKSTSHRNPVGERPSASGIAFVELDQCSPVDANVAFWPDAASYNVSTYRLTGDRALPTHLDCIQGDLRTVAVLVDVLRALQPLEAAPRHVQPLIEEVAERVRSIADAVRHQADSEAIRIRTATFSGRMAIHDPALRSALYDRAPSELDLFCGLLKTWQQKSPDLYYSFYAAVPAGPTMERVASVSAGLDEIGEQAGELLRLGSLHVAECGRLCVENLITCAGEVDRHPKHFAYFLPEDEGVNVPGVNRTVVFANFYRHQFEVTTRALIERFAPQVSATCPSGPALETALPLWMQAHDIGHFTFPVARPGCHDASVGRFANRVIEELVADLLSVAILSTESWAERSGVPRDAAFHVYLAELVRYAMRDKRSFPDSASAFLQLAWLSQGRGLNLAPGPRFDFDPDELRHGLLELARLVVTHLDRGRRALVPLLESLLFDEHGVRRLDSTLATMRAKSFDVPQYTLYVRP